MTSGRKTLTYGEIMHVAGNGKPTNKSNITIQCPICSKRKLNINFSKEVYNCASCAGGENKVGGKDPVALYALLEYNVHPSDIRSDKELRRKYFREIMHKLGNEVPIVQKAPVFNVDEAPLADEYTLDKTYRGLQSKLILYDDHFNNLSKRGLSTQAILDNGYRTVPDKAQCVEIAQTLLTEGYVLDGVPGFYIGSDGKWRFRATTRGVLIFIKNTRGMIVGAQIMNDDKESSAKYFQLSSANMEYGKRGSSAGTPIHLAGYPEHTMYLTEGPLKADIAYNITNKPFIAILGINALGKLKTALQDLKAVGVRKIIIAIDMDFKTNVKVAEGRIKIIKLIESFGFVVDYKFSWDETYKGIDDFLVAHAMKHGTYKPEFRVPWNGSSVHPYDERTI